MTQEKVSQLNSTLVKLFGFTFTFDTQVYLIAQIYLKFLILSKADGTIFLL
jgi:hypothetical protein